MFDDSIFTKAKCHSDADFPSLPDSINAPVKRESAFEGHQEYQEELRKALE